jgi:signal transduction histidine kinase
MQRRSSFTTEEVVLLLLRVVSLSMGAVAISAVASPTQALPPILALTAIAAAASALTRTRANGPWIPAAEASAAALVLGLAPPESVVLTPYLVAPAAAAGLQFGTVWALLTAGTSVLGFAGGALLSGQALDLTLIQVPLVILASGLFAAWVRRTLDLRRTSMSEQAAYEEATLLLAELRELSRPMSGGLDPRPLAAGLLREITRSTAVTRALVAIRVRGDDRVVASHGEPPITDWLHVARSETGSPRESAPGPVAFPIQTTDRLVGWLALEQSEAGEPATRASIAAEAQRWALRLDAAALFEEVRELATEAERARIAREMHDGVAQDIASLGLTVDELVDCTPPALNEPLIELRGRISDLVTQLRLSIHDLRQDGVGSGGLSAALADAARRECAPAGIAIHLRLADGSTEMPRDIETEMYRIAEEAVVNVRRHSGAGNLWLSCFTGPGGTVVSIEDDGAGIGPGRQDSAGMSIMTERAARIGAQLSFMQREGGGGTVVRVVLPHGGRAGAGDDSSPDSRRPRPDTRGVEARPRTR